MKSNKKVNTKELLRHAFDIMQLLKSGALTTEEAKAHANLLKQSNNVLKYELDRAVSIQKYESLQIRDIEDE
ncbi:hypothetical protein RPMD05_13 [Rhodobacteraceae phage LS06-2018-MD05]|nr:hypothetical protein RPMD05_13 [Rhodobacteraceae phage LS06-2018-MD05]